MYPLRAVLCGLILAASVAQAERSPTGVIDQPPQSDRIYGWAYDPDRSGQSIGIHVYYGGPAGVGTGRIYTTDFPRGDVNAAFKISGVHGYNIPFDNSFRTGRPVTAYVYAIDANGNPNVLLGSRTYTLNPPWSGKVGILYQISHAFAWRSATANRNNIRTVQDVLSSAALKLTDLLPAAGTGTWPLANEINFVSQTNPIAEDGQSQLYCYFDAQPSRDPFKKIACNTTRMLEVARRHVRQLAELGVDFLLIDNTNAFMDNQDFGGEVTYFRPIEVFFSKWKAAVDLERAANPNLVAPKLVVWSAVPAGSTYYTRMLRLYDNPNYDSIIYKHYDGRKIAFYVDPNPGDPNERRYPSAGILNEIASHNITPVPMWTHFGANGLDTSNNYRWDFISPCRVPGSNTRGTTSVSTIASCNQFVTTSSPIGSVITATPSYQIPGATASQAFGASGRLGGLTLKRQFDAVFAHRPDFVFISSWNEHGAGPFADPTRGRALGIGDKLPSAPTAAEVLAERMVRERYQDISLVALGHPDPNEVTHAKARLESAYNIRFTNYADLNRQYPVDNQRMNYSHYVDDYATEFSKDLEPTREYGNDLFLKAKALIQLYKSGARSCDPNVAACRNTSDYRAVAALRDTSGRYWYGPASAKGPLISAGYREICAPNSFQSDFCSNPADPYLTQGPFLAYGVSKTGTRALTRCYSNNTREYWLTANAADCNQSGVRNDGIAAWVAVSKSKEMLRVVNRCARSGYRFLAVDNPCPAGSTAQGVLGYVH